MRPDPPPARRLPGAVKTIAVVVVLLALGGGAAYALAGKLAPKPPRAETTVGGGASPTAQPTVCSATPAAPQPVGQASPSAPPASGQFWVNTPLGVNLRSGASASAAKIATLTQGTVVTVTGQAADAAGNRWASVLVGSQSGWVRSDFIVPTPIKPVTGDSFSLMIPSSYSSLTQGGVTDVHRPAESTLPFLRVQTSTTAGIGIQLPTAIRPDVAALPDHTALIQVWSYTVLERITRMALDACTVPDVRSRPDGGWPYVTSVLVHAPSRTYSFTFFTSTPDDPTVQQVLDSVATS